MEQVILAEINRLKSLYQGASNPLNKAFYYTNLLQINWLLNNIRPYKLDADTPAEE